MGRDTALAHARARSSAEPGRAGRARARGRRPAPLSAAELHRSILGELTCTARLMQEGRPQELPAVLVGVRRMITDAINGNAFAQRRALSL